MRESLLAHIASNFISEYENVANSSIAYLLNHYSAARQALQSILSVESIPNYYLTELSAGFNGRPDVTGLSPEGQKDVIIEGKFWANLTENQPNNYLNELSSIGKILFLCPEKRLSSLKLEVTSRAGANSQDRIYVSSWSNFLLAVEAENSKDFDSHLGSDLSQLKELCHKMDTEGMPPLSASDLDPMNGKITSHLSDLVEECSHMIRKWPESDFKNLRATSQKYGHGFYFRAYGLSCNLHFDSEKWYTRDLHTPIWLSVFDEDFKTSPKIDSSLSLFQPENSYANEIGIVLRPGMDRLQAANHIVDDTRKVLQHISETQKL